MQQPLTEEVALRYRLPIFVLPCPDYAIRRAGAAGSAVDSSDGDGDGNGDGRWATGEAEGEGRRGRSEPWAAADGSSKAAVVIEMGPGGWFGGG